MGIYGQDWASYQPSQPDTSGLAFAIVKITEGMGYANPRWTAQRDHAKAQGLVWGGYHYPHMGNDPHAEADRFLALMQPQPGDLIVLDWEGYDPANSGVTAAQQLAYKESWLRYVKARAPHSPVGMYCNTDYWRRVDTTGYYADFLWIATAGAPAGQPGINAPWLFHQYTDQPVDSDYCHLGSTAELRAWALSFAQDTPTPQEDPVTPEDAAMLATAVWDHQIANAQTGKLMSASTPLTWLDANMGAQGARIAALEATVGVLAKAVGDASPGVDTATLVAAVQAAIAAAVVHVDVQVGSTPSPAPASN